MGVTYFKRYRMQIRLHPELFPPLLLPNGYRLVPWNRDLLFPHADTKYRSFCDEIDAHVFPCLGDMAGCHRLMEEISDKQGFLPGATWLAVHSASSRRPVGILWNGPGDCRGSIEWRHPELGRDSGASRPGPGQGVVAQGVGRFLASGPAVGFTWRSRRKTRWRFPSTANSVFAGSRPYTRRWKSPILNGLSVSVLGRRRRAIGRPSAGRGSARCVESRWRAPVPRLQPGTSCRYASN